jgi:hypothetical protein
MPPPGVQLRPLPMGESALQIHFSQNISRRDAIKQNKSQTMLFLWILTRDKGNIFLYLPITGTIKDRIKNS